jgi:hypothetical protein
LSILYNSVLTLSILILFLYFLIWIAFELLLQHFWINSRFETIWIFSDFKMSLQIFFRKWFFPKCTRVGHKQTIQQIPGICNINSLNF